MKGSTTMYQHRIDLPDYVQIHRAFQRSWHRLASHEQKAVRTTIGRLHEHPEHPSLHVHALKRLPGVKECYVSHDLRLLYRREQSTLHLLNVGAHAIVEHVH